MNGAMICQNTYTAIQNSKNYAYISAKPAHAYVRMIFRYCLYIFLKAHTLLDNVYCCFCYSETLQL